MRHARPFRANNFRFHLILRKFLHENLSKNLTLGKSRHHFSLTPFSYQGEEGIALKFFL